MRINQLLLASLMFATTAVHAQSPYKILHSFGIGNDGAGLWSSVVFDEQGDLYGTTTGGGLYQAGTVFELTPEQTSEWSETILYSFYSSPDDGAGPFGGVIFGPDGKLYGTTSSGGIDYCTYGCGTIFELVRGLGGWTETVVYDFCARPDCVDGGTPYAGVIVDMVGNLYGTAHNVFELSPTPLGWIENVLHNFTGQGGDGDGPQAGPTMDPAERLYGTTEGGGGSPKCIDHGCGTVYELQPTAEGPGIWRERILHRFGYTANDGAGPGSGQLAMDREGSLYGTAGWGTYDAGIIYRLTPVPSSPDAVWGETILYNLTGGVNGQYPVGVTLDSTGNLYGVTIAGGSPNCGCGVVFKLAPQPGGQWQYTLLHTFEGIDGAQPDANLTIGPDGNLYGTTATGGAGGAGIVFQIQIAP